MQLRTPITEPLERHINCLLPPETAAQRSVANDNSYIDSGGMQVPREEAVLLAFLANLVAASLTVEIGVFTGYSLIATASALAETGRCIGLEKSEEWASIARRNVEDAGLSERVDIRVGDASEILQDLLDSQDVVGRVDLVFIDADKAQYAAYFAAAARLVRAGGLIVIDNVFWSGEVAAENPDPDAASLRDFTISATRDPRFRSSLLTMCDGVLVLQKLIDQPTESQQHGGTDPLEHQ